MRTSFIFGNLVLALILVATGLGCNLNRNPGSDAAIEAVKRRTDVLADAVRRRDGAGMIGMYAERDSVVFSSHGVLIPSRNTIEGVYNQWKAIDDGLDHFAWENRRYEVLGPEAVLAMGIFTWAMADSTGSMPDTLRGSWTGVFTETDGHWALVHEHESFQSK